MAMLWGYCVRFTFRAVKLLDYRAEQSQLEGSPNPFAHLVLAHLSAQETRRNPGERLAAKLASVRRLYGLGYDRDQVLRLFRFIDWVLRLPDELERRFWDELQTYEEVERMPYITSVERIGREEGFREGLLAGLELALKLKFGEADQSIVPEIRALSDVTVIQKVYARIETATTVDEVRGVYHSSGAS
jgi:hypothetical protein